MLPFSKRPPPPEEYFLRSGDFEQVNANSSNQYIPPAPRAPVFARQAAHTPYGFVQNQNQNQYGQYGDLSVPPPPHSLAPVAMGAMGTDSRNFASTGTNRSQQGTVLIREKPSLKWGVMIALTGALLGGVLGLGMDARRQSARAAAAAEARDAAPAPPPMAATALPQPVAVPVAVAVAVAPKPVLTGVAPVVNVNAQPAAVLPQAAPIFVQPVAKVAKTARRPSVTFAAKVPQPKPEAAQKAEPEAPKAAKAAEPKAEKAETPKAAAKNNASTKAAQDLLEQANKDTVNTL